jgi:uncharacterized protein YjbI with pentapeptide repeats
MLILVKPTFTYEEGGETVTKFISYMTGEQEAINQGIIGYLNYEDFFPGREIKRLEDTDFFTIKTLPEEQVDNIRDIYFTKLRDTVTSTLVQFDRTVGADVNIDAEIKFSTFENNEGMYDNLVDNISNSDIAQLKDDGEQLIDLRLDTLYLGYTAYVGANFFESRFNNSDFTNAELFAANFAHSRLKDSVFVNTDLRHATFSAADLRDTNFHGATLRHANFSGANLAGADLAGADLRHAILMGANFRGANLAGADLRYAFLDDRTNFTDCTMTDTKLYATDWEATIHTDSINDASFLPGEDAEDEGEYGDEDGSESEGEVINEDEDDEVDMTYANELSRKADKVGVVGGDEVLEPFVLDPNDTIAKPTPGHDADKTTYEDIVNLLSPKITNVKIPLSEMGLNKWYGIASLGNTDRYIWEQIGVKTEPRIGMVFRSEAVPNPEGGEAIVYETVPACMSVHELSRSLDIQKILQTFLKIVGAEKVTQEYRRITSGNSNQKQNLEMISMYFYSFLIYLLSNHNADEKPDSWAQVYADIDKRKIFVKHALFHPEEGIMNHPRFDNTFRNSYNSYLLLILMFIESLPFQIQVAWAQNYIKEFIQGYEQSLDTFDPKRRSHMGFIASCLNGNLEKSLLSIRTAITHFYPEGWGLEEDSAEEKLRVLKNAVTGSEFEKYFGSVEDIAGPTLEGYKKYIQDNPDINADRKQKFLSLLEDPAIIAKIEETIQMMSGGRRRVKNRKLNKKDKKIKKNKTYKKNKKEKKTIKKNKNYNNLKKKKTIRKIKKNKTHKKNYKK